MLKITIELIPFGLYKVKDYWIADIWNDATGSPSLGNYGFKIYQKNSTFKLWKSGEIKNFQRLRWSVWYLLYLCLRSIYEEE